MIDKWTGIQVGEWEIVDSAAEEDPDYIYEDVEVGELLDRTGHTKEQKGDFLRKYAAVNIHQLVSEQTYDDCLELLSDMKSDPRLAKLNAVVFLMLKPKGRGKALGQLKDRAKYKALVDAGLNNDLRIGFDSCSVPSFLSVVADHPKYAQFDQMTDRCESGLFSLYIDVHGQAWPCSFGQSRHDLQPINVLEVEDFGRDVWRSDIMDKWRARLCGNCRSCPLYDIDVEGVTDDRS